MDTSGETIMAALIDLHPRRFSDLTRSLASDLRIQQRRLSSLILSPLHFSQSLAYLHSLSLAQKALLVARLLLRSLKKLLSIPTTPNELRPRDLDAALLLTTMCEVYNRDAPDPPSGFNWHAQISDHLLASTLSLAGLGANGWWVLARYVDAAVKCRRLVDAASRGKAGREVGASAAAVLALPSVECGSAGRECAICRDEIEVGTDVCGLPCEHVFHWVCILPWLRKRNSCPCCRFELPTDDVFCEIERVWRVAVRMSGRGDV